ncbi:MAG: PAS domain S-box protein [Sedimentisphaerales bacterium]|nr:PAS domain S-box protein [Sedimentisphaerales bacterium]
MASQADCNVGEHGAEPESLYARLSDLERRLQQSGHEASTAERRCATLRSVLLNMPVMIDAFDTRGLIVVWNRECTRVTGYAAKEIIGNPRAMEMLYPDAAYRRRMMRQWKERGDDYYNWEWKMSAKDGSIKTVLWSNIAQRLPIAGWASWGIGVDVTARKEAEERLNVYHAKMARAEELASVGTLSAALAHELSQDLTAIRLGVQNALAELQSGNDHDNVKDDLEDAVAAIANVMTRVREIKDFARLSWRDTVRRIELDKICMRIANLLQSLAEQARVAIHVVAPRPSIWIRANETDMEQLFFSLVENAIQAADGKSKHRVTIRILGRAEEVELRFTDDCGGIAPGHLEKVCQPFFTTKPPGIGTGLGLFIVQSIVERARGTLHIDSTPGAGTTVTVILPIAEQR